MSYCRLASFVLWGVAALAALDSESRPTPNSKQLAWQRLEFVAFANFGTNTFTDREWGEAKEDPKLHNRNMRQALKTVRSTANRP